MSRPLSAYLKKRHLSKTPEPAAKKNKKNSGPLRFVVQKHAARSLHFDFRLELNGVLKSWAVPKGPSLSPKDKRLAVMVEDHPLDYQYFKGVIPKGNYGAGSVEIWDSGVYAPYETVDREQAEKFLNKQLKDGHLTFILLGQKLKGEFALVKIKSANRRTDNNAWLMIKKGDEYALGQTPGVKAKYYDSMPTKVKPMLAETADVPFDKADWIFEMKWDGYRAIAEIKDGNVKLYSRNHQPFNEKFAPIAKSLESFPGQAVLDGEVVVLDESGQPNFQLLQDYSNSKAKGKLVYYVFDILYLNGQSLEKLPLSKRKEVLKDNLPNLPGILYSDHLEKNGIEFFRQVAKMGLEGIMAKDSKSIYKPGARSSSWLKIKTNLTQTAVIGGYTLPKGGRKYFGALVLGTFKNGKLEYIGHVGSGFNDQSLKDIYKQLKPLITDVCPFNKKPQTNTSATWVKPEITCEVSFSSWTNSHQMRHPIFISLNEEKTIFSKDTLDKEDTEVIIGKRTLKLTHLSKVFWPKEGYTKGDLVNYYREISPLLLPHLKNRPESLLRFPHGVTGESFFQKDASHLKMDWVYRARVHHSEKNIEYLLCQDEPSLIYMINLGCIDLNPWNSSLGHLDKPDYLVIDLDPGDKVGFEIVVKVALETRGVLENLGIASFPKTSGASGMHIYLPMGAKYDYAHVRQFAELLCTHINQQIPDLTSLTRNPKERKDKVYLDYLQNSRGQTLASVYSVRPKPQAPVSTPLQWLEVNSKLHPTQFTIKNIPGRVQKTGDLFKGVLGKGVKIETVLKKLESSKFK